MLKRKAVVAIAAAMAMAGTVSAADIEEPVYDVSSWYLAISGGLNQIFETDFDDDDTEFGEGEIEFDYGFRGGAAIGYYWTENLRSELEFAYSSTGADEFEEDDGGDEFDLDGSLDIFSLLAKIDYEMQFFSWWRPYIGVGAGFAVVSADDIHEDGDDTPSLDGDDVVFAGAVEVGSKFILSDNVELFTQSQLMILSDADIDYDNSDEEGTLESPIVWSSSLGLRFRF